MTSEFGISDIAENTKDLPLTENQEVHPHNLESLSEDILSIYPPSEKRRILKNFLVLNIAIMFWRTDMGISFLQSSVHEERGLGNLGLATYFALNLLSTLFLSNIFIKHLGFKGTIALCLTGALPMTFGHLFPRFYTLIPGQMLKGLCSGPLLSAVNVYLCLVTKPYSILSKCPKNILKRRIFAFHNIFHQIGNFLGNLISYIILSLVDNKHSPNKTINHLHSCGAKHCPGEPMRLEHPSIKAMYFYVGLIVFSNVVATTLVLIFLGSLSRYPQFTVKMPFSGLGAFRIISVTLEVMRDTKQQMFSLMSVCSGVINSFNIGIFSSAYVSCGWGFENVGLVYMVFSLSALLFMFISNYLLRYVNRSVIIYVSMFLNLVVLFGLLLWSPRAKFKAEFFVFATLLSSCGSTFTSTQLAVFGVMFKTKREAAFSNYKLFYSLGNILGFAYSHYLCTGTKIYLAMFFNIVGLSSYMTAELLF